MIKLINFESVTLATKTWARQKFTAIHTPPMQRYLRTYENERLGATQQRKSAFVCSTCVDPGSGDIHREAEHSAKDVQKPTKPTRLALHPTGASEMLHIAGPQRMSSSTSVQSLSNSRPCCPLSTTSAPPLSNSRR